MLCEKEEAISDHVCVVTVLILVLQLNGETERANKGERERDRAMADLDRLQKQVGEVSGGEHELVERAEAAEKESQEDRRRLEEAMAIVEKQRFLTEKAETEREDARKEVTRLEGDVQKVLKEKQSFAQEADDLKKQLAQVCAIWSQGLALHRLFPASVWDGSNAYCSFHTRVKTQKS